MPETLRCPDCGSPLSSEAWGEDLCMVCLLRLAAPSTQTQAATNVGLSGVSTEPQGPDAATTAESLTPAPALQEFKFIAGDVLADRYRVLKRLGRGGMGEVWRAYDLKLRVDVALKSLNEAIAGKGGLELMRGEVRAAREVISPNVCRIFDLIEIDGHELVSMEYVDGHTLLRTLDERGPLGLQEAADIGAQLLAGLDAIHGAGLVHRDIKPENVMLTRAKRVVVMDFGLTAPSGEGMQAGTPAYMPPEQARGEPTDARADIFSAGIVLAELLSVGGDAADAVRHEIWKSVREDPASLPEIPWRRVLLKAVAGDPDERYLSAAEMARTLEKVSIRVEGAEDRTPYPGLAAYETDAADFFFGREAEVEQLWKKLQHAHLLGLIGASGAGKSSFVQAGLLPARPAGWADLEIKPGADPFMALSRALRDELSYDPTLVAALEGNRDADVAYEALAAWRAQHREVLLVVDQFEELFTQSKPADQAAFTELLAHAALDANVHVLLSMRDDFLMRCYDFPALAPIFSELTPLKPPVGGALRRALVHPALKCGYQFEDESIVEEMLEEVTKERAALPLIAFTAARLWEERERDTGLLTHDAYDRIGGVGGALAQHADETLERIGAAHTDIVREIFRNLVTADGTRAAAEFDELLTLFDTDQRDDARTVLQGLIDSRLLTSYEVRDEEGGTPTRRVEVAHESLLSAWPRLVRWRSQDADSVQLRDELRQAARRWDSRGRTKGLLWSGTAYREFSIWRQRYPGRLTELESEFAQAMTRQAERAGKRRRRVVTGVIAALLVVVAGMTGLWRQSEAARLRAEAQRMVAQARPNLESYPTAALAWAIRSLEVADTREGRELAVEALWAGPPAFKVNDYPGFTSYFSPDGSELLQSTRRSMAGGNLFQVIGADGSSVGIPGGDPDTERLGGHYQLADPDMILSYQGFGQNIAYGRWSASQRRHLGQILMMPATAEIGHFNAELGGVVQLDWEGDVTLGNFGDGSVRVLTSAPPDAPRTMARDGRWFAQLVDGRVETIALDVDGASPPRLIGLHPGANGVAVSAETGRVVTRDPSGEIRIWTVDLPGATPTDAPPRVVAGPPGPAGRLQFSTDGELITFRRRDQARTDDWLDLWAVVPHGEELRARRLGVHPLHNVNSIVDPSRNQVGALIRGGGRLVWHRLDSPDGTLGLNLFPGAARNMQGPSFHPNGEWIAAQHSWLTVWSLARDYPMVIPGQGSQIAFAPDGSEFFVAATSPDRAVGDGAFAFPLGEMPGPRRLLTEQPLSQMSPDGETMAVTRGRGEFTSPVFIGSDGTEIVAEKGLIDGLWGRDFSPDSRLFAGVGGQFDLTEQVIRVWDVATGELVAEHAPEILQNSITVLHTDTTFAGNRHLIWSNSEGTHLWNIETGEQRLLDPRITQETDADVTGSIAIGVDSVGRTLMVIDLTTGTVTDLPAYGDHIRHAVISPDGRTVASIDLDGVIRVGSPTLAEPHLLFTHPGLPASMAIDPTGRWLGTTSDEEIRLWPLPDVDEAPLHTLPYDELLAKLRTLTNVRLVEDPEAATGWSLSHDPFPGFANAPIW